MSRKDTAHGLLVSPIRNGTVIDHITAGEALNVLRILGITGSTTECLSIATNVESRRLGKKDIVKIENRTPQGGGRPDRSACAAGKDQHHPGV